MRSEILIYTTWVLFFFKIFTVLLENRINREEKRQRGRSSVCDSLRWWLQRSVLCRFLARSQEHLSRSPMQVQGPKALGRPQLFSLATSRELYGSGAARIRTGDHME